MLFLLSFASCAASRLSMFARLSRDTMGNMTPVWGGLLVDVAALSRQTSHTLLVQGFFKGCTHGKKRLVGGRKPDPLP